MQSVVTSKFRSCFNKLPMHIKRTARKAYALWKENPQHPSLRFKPVSPQEEIYSVRVNLGYRALGVKDGDTIIWFWIGTHTDYDELIKAL